LTAHDALGAHQRDELGISDTIMAHPVQAAVVSAITFAIGAALPLIVATAVPLAGMIWTVGLATLVALAGLGALGAGAGGAGWLRGAVRVMFWGALAMAATAAVGAIFGVMA
ncbi:MAG: VIT1/CCC1 transporter family protein, partial [Paracoccaceae bacterium]|nr:VIT1/CCC1 transporter family protein [Paracoccaceae bacterium]